MSTPKSKPATPRPSNITVSHCHLVGVQFDGKHAETMTAIAEGLTENAKALGMLASVLLHNHVKVGPLMEIGTLNPVSIG